MSRQDIEFKALDAIDGAAMAPKRADRLFTELLALTHLCIEIEENSTPQGDCVCWTGRVTSEGDHPVMRHYGKDKLVRRLLWTAIFGDVPAGQQLRTKCRNTLCVNIDHFKPMTHARIGKLAAKETGWPGFALRRMRIAASRRADAPKLTMEIARTIRASDESGPVLAARHNINKSLVNRIKRGQSWAESVSSPFAGLLS